MALILAASAVVRADAPPAVNWLDPSLSATVPVVGDFSDPANWNPAAVPSAANEAVVNNGGMVNITTAVTPQMIWLGSGVGTVGFVNMTGGSVTTNTVVNGDAGSPYGGDIRIGGSAGGISGAGTFYQSGGTINLVSASASNGASLNVGYGTGAEGNYYLSGGTIAGTTALGGNINFVVVGNGGSAGYFQQTGGQINQQRVLDVGRNGSIGLYELHAGTANLTLDAQVGGGSGMSVFTQAGTGTVVQNGGALVLGRNLDVAYSDVTTIASTIKGAYYLAGGTITAAGRVGVGEANGSTGTFRVNGGAITSTGDLVIGGQTGLSDGGTGTFNLAAGSVAVGANVNVGLNAASVGTLNISGGSLTLTKTSAQSLFVVGNSNTAAGGLAVVNQTGGVVTNTGFTTSQLEIGRSSGASGQGVYNLAGGTLATNNLVVMYNASQSNAFNFTGGTLALGKSFLAGINRSTGATFGYTLTNSGGTLAPGGVGVVATVTFSNLFTGAGSGTASSAYAQTAAGTLAIDIASSTSYDQMVLANGATATVAGAIVVNTLGTFNPLATDNYNILSGGAVTDAAVLVDNSAANVTFTKTVVSGMILRLNAVVAPNLAAGANEWAANASWSTGTYPNASGAKAHFGTNGSGPISVSSPVTAGVVNLNSTAGYALSGAPITLAQPAATAAINSALGNHSIADDLSVSNTTVVNVANSLTLGGTVSGAGGVTKSGTGNLVLAHANAYAGKTQVNAGTLTLTAAGALGPAGLNFADFSGAVLNTTGTSQATAFLSGGAANAAGVNAVTINLAGGNLTVGADAANATYAGNFTGNGTLTKIGAGTQALTGTAALASATVSGGTLAGTVANLPGVITDNANLQFNQELDGTYAGTIAGPGSVAKVGAGTLSIVNSQSYTGGTVLSSGVLVAPVAAVRNGDLTFNTNPASAGSAVPPPDGTLRFADGGTIGASHVVTLNGTGTLDTAGANVTVAGSVVGGGTLVKSGTGTLVLANAANSYAGGTRVNAGVLSVGSSANLGGGPLTLDGGTLRATSAFSDSRGVTLLPFGGIVDAAAAVSLAGVLSGQGSLTKIGAGTLTLSGVNTYAGFTQIFGGTLRLGSPGALPTSNAITIGTAGTLDVNGLTATARNLQGAGNVLLAGGNLTANVTSDRTYAGTISGSGSLTKLGAGSWGVAGAGVRVNGPLAVTEGTMSLIAGSGAASVAGLSVTTALLDLTNDPLVINYAGATPADTVRGYLASARNGGGWDGVTGVTSATAAANAARTTAIGYAEAANILGLAGAATTTWNGVAVDATSLLLKYTWYGDLNLNGKIDADDYALLDRGFAKHLTGWGNGDVNYDNVVNASDYLIVDTTFGQQTGTLSPAMLAQREAQFGDAYVNQLIAAVPEPAGGTLLVLGAVIGRRRRRTF